MAFGGEKKKDVSKQSYYVWFLGAKESKGLNGGQDIRPVLSELLEKERELEPVKVTLQVSNKGLKIIQNVSRKNNGEKTGSKKLFIPRQAIASVTQESTPHDDVVCVILVIDNALMKCLIHLYAYRCDSIETATTLRNQITFLIDRMENQKMLGENETYLKARGIIFPRRKLSSDGHSTRTDDSDQSDDFFSSDRDVLGRSRENTASLFDSVAAELREKLNSRNTCPILLPPKDYDTVSRKQGKLQGIEERRSTNSHVVGINQRLKNDLMTKGQTRESDSSGKSREIHKALSLSIPTKTFLLENRGIDPCTSSDEDVWPSEDNELDILHCKEGIPLRHLKQQSCSSHSTSMASQAILPTPLKNSVAQETSTDDWYNRFQKPIGSLDKTKPSQVACPFKKYKNALQDEFDITTPFSYHIPQSAEHSMLLSKSEMKPELRLVHRQRNAALPLLRNNEQRYTSLVSNVVKNHHSNSVPGGFDSYCDFSNNKYHLQARNEDNHPSSSACSIGQGYHRDQSCFRDMHSLHPERYPIKKPSFSDLNV
ncbi:uncharacterized protein LOC143238079 [Tachypleus tridentatus]|uniref:uncharacterized protein LOC143238079 n=1 Tax=Tachypleus tridentatus TaxID=6853 RepID=UPI003FD6BBBF